MILRESHIACWIKASRHPELRCSNNKIADCLSRLTSNIRKAPYYPISEPRLSSVAKSAKAFQTQMETSDPWVLQLGEAATNDLEYVNMRHNIENGVTGNN